MCLADFIDRLDDTKSGTWHSLCRAILLEKGGVPLDKFDADHSIKNVLTAEETALMRYCIKNLSLEDILVRLSTRDEFMPMTIKLIMSLYQPQTVTIHAHFAHLNYGSNTFFPWYMVDSPSTGYSLKQTFKDDYACITLSSASGRTYDWGKNKPILLEEPPLESLEQSLSTMDENLIFLPMNSMTDSDWHKIRRVGSTLFEGMAQFVDVVPCTRTDGIIVVKEAEPIPSRQHTSKEIDDNFLRRLVDAASKYPLEQKTRPQQNGFVGPESAIIQNGEIVNSDSIVFDVCEEMPEMPGGTPALMNYLQRNIHYPLEAQEAKKKGVVLVQFIVEKDGSISNPVVKMSVDPLLDAEAVRVITTMPKWNPGKQKGIPVRSRCNIPVRFVLVQP